MKPPRTLSSRPPGRIVRAQTGRPSRLLPALVTVGLATLGWQLWSHDAFYARLASPSVLLPPAPSPERGESQAAISPAAFTNQETPPTNDFTNSGSTHGLPVQRDDLVPARSVRSLSAPVSDPAQARAQIGVLTVEEQTTPLELAANPARDSESVAPSAPPPDSSLLPLKLPMAALDPSPSMPQNAIAETALAQLNQDFITAVINPDPTADSAAGSTADPTAAITQRWQVAQPLSDQQFRQLYGYQAYMDQQMQQYLVQQAMAQLAAQPAQ